MRRWRRPGAHAVVAFAFLAVAIAMTWPLGRLWHPVLPQWDDSNFNVWRLAWVAHQLKTDPWHLFDTNVFYPATNTLAFSDAMLLLGVAGAPLIWLGIHPYVVHNVAVITSFWLAAYFGYRLCYRLTAATAPSIVGGIIFGFAPYRYGHIAHLELLWTAFMPLGLWALVDLVERPSAAAGFRLGLFFVLQTLCSVYYGMYFSIFLSVATVVMLVIRRDVVRDRFTTILKAMATAAGVAAILLLPYLVKYSAARQSIERRPVDEIMRFSAVPSDYLRVARDNKVLTSEPMIGEEERALFPGFVAIVLSALAATLATRASFPYLILLAVSVELSWGMHGFLYRTLVDWAPVLTGLRAPARFGSLVLLCIAILGSLGAAKVANARRVGSYVVPVLAAVMLFEYWAAPLQIRERPRSAPPAYAWLAQQPGGVVLELPMPDPNELWAYETEYQLMSIYHWHPLLNGYSGNAPRSYMKTCELMQTFPSHAALGKLRELDVRWVLIHEGLMTDRKFADLMLRVEQSGAFRVVATFPDGMGRAVVLELTSTTL